MRAIAFGKDGFAGDDGFTCESIDTTSSTFEAIYQDWLLFFWSDASEGEMPSPEQIRQSIENNHEPIVGFWMLTEQNHDILTCLDLVDIYSTDERACLNRAKKTLCHKLAEYIIGDDSVLG